MNTFDEATLRKLERLTLVAEQVRVGRMKGDRRSRKRGTSIEFADYRDYSKGDDLRRLDWNVYARLDKPFLKLLEEEEDLAVHVLVDSSASMNWPDSEATENNKLKYALRLAGALGHIGLSTNDLVYLEILNNRGNRHWGPHRGSGFSMPLFQFLEAVTSSGTTNLSLSLREYALRGRRSGLLLLISDLLSPAGYKEGVNALLSRGYEVGIIHLLSPEETSPQFAGDLRLVDVETGQDTEISLDVPTANIYRQRLEAWLHEIAAHCHSLNVHYVSVITNTPWEQLVMRTLPTKGILK